MLDNSWRRKLVDELLMPLEPQIAGRKADAIRAALVPGLEFMPDCAPWFQLLSVKQDTAPGMTPQVPKIPPGSLNGVEQDLRRRLICFFLN